METPSWVYKSTGLATSGLYDDTVQTSMDVTLVMPFLIVLINAGVGHQKAMIIQTLCTVVLGPHSDMATCYVPAVKMYSMVQCNGIAYSEWGFIKPCAYVLEKSEQILGFHVLFSMELAHIFASTPLVESKRGCSVIYIMYFPVQAWQGLQPRIQLCHIGTCIPRKENGINDAQCM